jgi:hypothetical protein
LWFNSSTVELQIQHISVFPNLLFYFVCLASETTNSHSPRKNDNGFYKLDTIKKWKIMYTPGLYIYHIQKQCCAKFAICNNATGLDILHEFCRRPAVKSNLSKHRDQKRMTYFIWCKTAESNVPFCYENDAFFQYNQTNNYVSNVSKEEYQKLKL